MMLSKRLQAVADMVTPQNIVADIGTDHGYVPIYLVKNHIVPHAIAMDINEGPLEKAKMNIASEGLTNQIDTILSDGMEQLKEGMTDSVIIAGMGGELITHILEASDIKGTLKEMVLSPHRDADLVRKYVAGMGWHITREEIVLDAGKYYNIFCAEPGRETSPYNEIEYVYGRLLLEEKNPILKEYLEKEYRKFHEIHQKMIEHHSRDMKTIENILTRNRKGMEAYD